MSDLKTAALEYHAQPRPGKLSVELTKPTVTARDLALAYSPGVAEPVREIARDAELAYRYTGKGNLVAVISDGTAILGLGNLGPLASKPVMEGKGVLFKRFAGIDVFDIEVDAESPQAFIDTVKRISITFGGINLEDIKAPECFEIERALIEQCDIPVFHDDQHGTAIVTAAGLLNALEVQGKRIEQSRIVCMGAGAAATACMDLLIKCGAAPHNIFMLDRQGVIHTGRTDLNQYKQRFANETPLRTLMDVIDGADVFVGVSGPDVLPAEAVALMSLKLWDLASLALPIFILLAAQTVAMALYAIFVTFRVMGSNYDAAVLAAGHCGFGLGATPTAIANMQAITQRFGPSHMAFLVVPMVGAFFIDIINAVVIKLFLALPFL